MFGELIRKRDRFWKRKIDPSFLWKKGDQYLRIVLQKSPFNRPGGRGGGQQKQDQ